jgi:hypothetical protein
LRHPEARGSDLGEFGQAIPEIGNHALEAFVELHLGVSSQKLPCPGNVRLSPLRIVLGQGALFEDRGGAGQFDRFFSQFADRELVRIAEVQARL